MKLKRLSGLIAALVASAAFIFAGAAPAAAASYIGQPSWQSDPTGVCSYPGRSGCPVVEATEPLPYAATQITGLSGVVSAATATATLTAVAAKTTYLTGFMVTGGGATAASVITCTITGVIGGTESFLIPVPAGATLGITPVTRHLSVPLQASAVNTNIVISCPTFGSGNTAASIIAEGFNR